MPIIVQEDDPLWSVYKHTSPSGKVYFGIAKDPKHRWRGGGNGYKGSTRIWYAIQKYGWDNFEHEILAHGLTRQEACDMEIKLIAEHRSMDPSYGYNLTSGGQCTTLSPESRAKLSASLMGHPVSDKVRTMLANVSKEPIICLETGEVFESGQDAADKMQLDYSGILRASVGKQDTCGGYHFARLRDYENGEIKRFVPNPRVFRKVRCVTTGEEFDNISDASRKTGLSRRSLSYACNGTHDTCGGLRWKFIDEKEDINDSQTS